MKQTKSYPYANTDLESLPNERWDDLPGLDGYYLISTFGRIKRQYREVLTADGKVMRFQEKIIRSYPVRRYNKSVKDFNYFLSASITIERQRVKLSVGRLVYYVFIDQFNLEDTQLVVYAKNGDGKDIKPTNLKLVDLKAKAKRIFERGRLKRTFYTSREEYETAGTLKSQNPYCRQVAQYNAEGKYIATFPSIRVAAGLTGASENGIVTVLKGRQTFTAGFHWAYGNSKKRVDLVALRNKKLEKRRKLVGHVVTQYSLEGKRISVYDSITIASYDTGVLRSDIFAVLTGRQFSAGGYIWRSGSGKRTISVKGQLFGQALRAERGKIPVGKFSKTGKLLKKYNSLDAAAEAEGCTGSNMSLIISQCKNYKGFYFKKLKQAN